MSKRKLTQREIENEVNKIMEGVWSDEDDDPFQCDDSSDESYNPSESDNSENNDIIDDENYCSSESDNSENEEFMADDTNNDAEICQETIESENVVAPDVIFWGGNSQQFSPRFSIPDDIAATTCLPRQMKEVEFFFKIFPRSLLMQIAEYTNGRLKIFERDTKKKRVETDYHEIMIVLGVSLVMCYNRVPGFNHYWSNNDSLGNAAIKKAISRDRCKLLLSKIYFNNPEKPPDAGKIFYVEEVVNCLKHTFTKYRTDSTFQSIDESMAKFKGRSSLKQYLPLKPIKRGIKIWVRSDSKTGYVYDLNIYAGKEMNASEGTLGERVVFSLSDTIKCTNVVLTFDRFFSSVHLLDTIKFPAVGTLMRNRKNVPKFTGNLERGESEFQFNENGSLVCRWQDTKEVLAISNCFSDEITLIKRTMKDGTKKEFSSPTMLKFYNEHMGGVDLTDQYVGLYDFDRRSNKWWKKVFYKLLMMSVRNAHILHDDVRRTKTSFLPFLITVAEDLITLGRSNANVKRKSAKSLGRPSKKPKLQNVGDHLPVEGSTRRRCSRCAQLKKEVRTKTLCRMCNIPLCKTCFTPYHLK